MEIIRAVPDSGIGTASLMSAAAAAGVFPRKGLVYFKKKERKLVQTLCFWLWTQDVIRTKYNLPVLIPEPHSLTPSEVLWPYLIFDIYLVICSSTKVLPDFK